MRALPSRGDRQRITIDAAGTGLLARLRRRAAGALTLYLARPITHAITSQPADRQSLAAVLRRGDVLLTEGNSRFAALIKRLTRSPWSHVSMYVGPLDEGPDPLCIVEADIAAGVRSIRLSELHALQIRVLRPIGLKVNDRTQLTDWVVGKIGSEFVQGSRRLVVLTVTRSLSPHPTPAPLP
jgi:hypothetical protein